MENSAVVNERGIHLGFGQHDICAGAAVKGKRAVAVCVQLDERQRRRHFFIDRQTGNVDTAVDERLPQKIAEPVFSDLADKGSFSAQTGVHRQNIRRCAAGIAGKQRDSLCIFSIRREVDQTFAECYNINHVFSPQTVFFAFSSAMIRLYERLLIR